MPLMVPQKALLPTGSLGLVGVNLRRDPLALADTECARAINADFHTIPGAARLRGGRTRLVDSNYNGQIVYVDRVNNRRYVVTTSTAYRDAVLIQPDLDPTGSTGTSYRPLNDSSTWTFLMNRAARVKDDGVFIRTWGYAAPTSAPGVAVGAAGGSTGRHAFLYTYLRKTGTGGIAGESNNSPSSVAIVVSNQAVNISALTDSADPQITHKRLYRTLNAGGLYLVDQDVPTGTLTATSTKLDGALGAQLQLDHNVPPACSWATEFQGTVFAVGDASHPDYLWFSKHFQPEYFPTDHFLQIGSAQDALLSAVPVLGLLAVFTRQTKYRVFGSSAVGYSYLEAISKRGTPVPRAVVGTDQGALFVARDGLFLSPLIAEDILLSSPIEPLWYDETVNDYAPIDWTRADEIAVAAWKQRFYFSYPTTDGNNMMAVYSRETQHWYFFQYAEPVTALRWELETGLLLAGTRGGVLTSLEVPGHTDESGLVEYLVEGKTRAAAGTSSVKAVFQFFRADIDAGGAQVLLEFVIDGVVRYRKVITGGRTRQLYRFPDNVMGHVWAPRIRYTGTTTIVVYGVEVYAFPLGYS